MLGSSVHQEEGYECHYGCYELLRRYVYGIGYGLRDRTIFYFLRPFSIIAHYVDTSFNYLTRLPLQLLPE